MIILGLYTGGHDSGVAVVKDGILIFHHEAERTTRQKHDITCPIYIIEKLLKYLNITIDDIDLVASSIPPWNLKNIIETPIIRQYYNDMSIRAYANLETLGVSTNYENLKDIRKTNIEILGREIPIYLIPHHLCHAAYAYYLSDFEDADIITQDGGGNFTSSIYCKGENSNLTFIEDFKSNIGALWDIVSKAIFGRIFCEGKTMALVAFGKPKYKDVFFKRYIVSEDEFYHVKWEWESRHNFPVIGNIQNWIKNFQLCADVASSLQEVTNEVLINNLKKIHSISRKKKLCLGGGVFYNIVLNECIAKYSPYSQIFVGPASGDSGIDIGAALYLYYNLLSNAKKYFKEKAYLGLSYIQSNVKTAIQKIKNEVKINEYPETALIDKIVNKISEGYVVALHQGRGESGPRALGNRSILADPTIFSHKGRINNIKRREYFRPLAPVVLYEKFLDYFSGTVPSPYMLFNAKVNDNQNEKIQAVIHEDGTARVQTVSRTDNEFLYNLLQRFYEAKGVPILINTSFNVKEPLVDEPDTAIKCFLQSSIDFLVIGNYFVTKKKILGY